MVDGGDLDLEGMLGRRLRVTVTDGRVMEGTMDAVDSHVNIVMQTEALGLIMVPGPHVVKCELLQVDQDDALAKSAPPTPPLTAEDSHASA